MSTHDPQLEAFAEAFLALNAQVNLSAAKDRDTLFSRHIDDSLTLLDVPELLKARRILDLGSGGGLPGLILALKLPDAVVTCLDATAKKVRAIGEMAEALGLDNVLPLHGRAEALGRELDHRQGYDVVVARAVAPLPTLLEYAAPFTRIHGTMIFMKGPEPEAEVAEAEGARRQLRVAEPRIEAYEVAGRHFSRVIYPVKQYVPKAFPRRNGLPRSRPLTGGETPWGSGAA